MNAEAKKYYNEYNSIFGLPQSYKGVLLYPLKIKDIEYINLFYELFAYPKISIAQQDIKILKMSYIKFLFYILQSIIDADLKEESFQDKLKRFLQYITKINEVFFKTPNEKASINNMIMTIEIGDKILTEIDFENIREIVLEQNGSSIEYVEEYNEALEKDLAFIYKNNKKYNFKDQVYSFAAQFYKTISEIQDCTIYEMKNLMDSMGAIQEYRLQVIPLTEVNKDYEFRHYLKHLENRGRYADVLQDVDEFKNKTDFFSSNEEIANK
jgi:hypothetical protein